jgi:hypothetical protein
MKRIATHVSHVRSQIINAAKLVLIKTAVEHGEVRYYKADKSMTSNGNINSIH